MRFFAFRTSAFCLVLLVFQSFVASAQSYGTGDQVFTIGAAAFHPLIGTNTGYQYNNVGNGYLFGDGAYVAPLSLPDGAEIFGACIDLFGVGTGGGIGMQIQATKLPGDGQDPGIYLVPGSDVSVIVLPSGYQTTCNSSAISYVFHDAADVDGLGTRNLAHRVYISYFQAGLGAVRILWRRQVSPAPMAATFTDVPTTDGAFPFIEALVGSGVTAGCGGGNYCPDAPLTRRQMAVFMSKALGLHWAN